MFVRMCCPSNRAGAALHMQVLVMLLQLPASSLTGICCTAAPPGRRARYATGNGDNVWVISKCSRYGFQHAH